MSAVRIRDEVTQSDKSGMRLSMGLLAKRMIFRSLFLSAITVDVLSVRWAGRVDAYDIIHTYIHTCIQSAAT